MSEDPTLAARLAAVEAELDAFRRGVTTRRVAIIDGEGVERVVLSAERQTGSVLVRLDRSPGRTTGVELVASEHGDEAPILGLIELRDGDVVDGSGG